MSIGEQVKRLADRRGLTQAELSRRSGVSRGHISSLIANRKPNLGLETVLRIAYALGVTLQDIVGDDLSVVEFAQSDGLTFEEYQGLLFLARGRSIRSSDWRTSYEQMRVSAYPGLSEFLKKYHLSWSTVKPLIERTQVGLLPETLEGWEEFHRWHKTFVPADPEANRPQ